MNLVSVECPSCGANLPPRAPTGHYTCDYCGAQFAQQQVKHAHDQAGHAISTDQLAQAIVKAQQMSGGVTHSAAPEVYNIPPQQAQKAVRRVLLFVAFTILVTAAIPIFLTLRSSGMFSGVGGGSGSAVVGGGPLGSEHLLWDDNGGPPAPVTIDGKPAVIGRTRAVGTEDALYIDAYSMDGERVWRVDGLGSYGDGYRHTRFAVAGSSVVISDKNATLRVVSKTSGAPQHEVTLTDRAEQLCVAETEGEQGLRVWVQQIDKKTIAIDPVSGEQFEGEPPESCLSDSERRRQRMMDRARRGNDGDALEVEGVRISETHQDGGLAVATAVKHPGTEVPRAIGFDPETNEVLWDEVVSKVSAASNRSGSSQHAALAGGRYYRVYGEGQELWHVAALDAKTGTSLWDVKLRPIFAVDSIDGLYASDTHVFVVRTSSMEVLDAKNGELVLTIGRETYD